MKNTVLELPELKEMGKIIAEATRVRNKKTSILEWRGGKRNMCCLERYEKGVDFSFKGSVGFIYKEKEEGEKAIIPKILLDLIKKKYKLEYKHYTKISTWRNDREKYELKNKREDALPENIDFWERIHEDGGVGKLISFRGFKNNKKGFIDFLESIGLSLDFFENKNF